MIRGRKAAKLTVKYHNDECRKQAQWTRDNDKRDRKVAEEVLDTSGVERSRKGEIFKRLVDTGDGERIDNGEISAAAVAEFYGTTPATVSRGMEAWRYDRDKKMAAGNFIWSWRVRALFPKEKLARLREIGLSLFEKAEDDDEFNRLADELTAAFAVYSRWYFKFKKKRVINMDFHLEWIRSILVAYGSCGKLYILSPPRHGKSEVLIRLFIWLIVMDPDIRIGWLAASKDIAKVMLGKVKAYLEHNEDLIADTLPPGEVYKPERSEGKPWATFQFTVTQAPAYDQKSATMTAFGRTSKILSLDFDVLAVDDIEDFDTCRDADQRNYSKDKFLEFGTRKEEETVWFGIGSRQHEDDIPASLMEGGPDEDGLAWKIMVSSAHDEMGCKLDPETIAGHDESGCMLFPDVRSYRWLMEKRREEERLGGSQGRYEMRYLNSPRPTTGLVFDMEKIREHALNPSRGIGLDELPDGIRLIAGIDPASRGTQAVVLWGVANGTMFLVDIETQEAGGFAGALRIMEQWHEQYGVTDFIYEDNSQQDEFFRDPRLTALIRKLALTVKNHTTGKNKQDPELGISAMAPFYHDGTIDLPYGSGPARQKVNVLLNQLKVWTTDGVSRGKGKTDVKMASWFPFPRIIRWLRQEGKQDTIAPAKESSYPTISYGSKPSWSTKYPGR